LPQSEVIRGSGTILVVDDEESIRFSTKIMLESIGYNVLLAENGKEGLDVFQNYDQEIDLVILDMIMPIMDGKETFTRLASLNKKTQVIIATGYANENDLQELIEKGVSAYIQKPFRKAQLSQVIHSILTTKVPEA